MRGILYFEVKQIDNKAFFSSEYESSIPRDLCREKASFQYGGDEASRLDFGADQELGGSISEWVNTRALEIILLPVSGGPVSFYSAFLLCVSLRVVFHDASCSKC